MTNAITGQYITQHGITLNNSFIVIPTGVMNEDETSFTFNIYANITAYSNGSLPLVTNTYSMLTNETLKNSMLNACFDFMKTLPQFSGMQDV